MEPVIKLGAYLVHLALKMFAVGGWRLVISCLLALLFLEAIAETFFGLYTGVKGRDLRFVPLYDGWQDEHIRRIKAAQWRGLMATIIGITLTLFTQVVLWPMSQFWMILACQTATLVLFVVQINIDE